MERFSVESASRPGTFHVVAIEGCEADCDCEAFAYRHTCRHIDKARALMAEENRVDDIQRRLAEPFHPDELEWRPGATNREKTSALALAYVTARAVQDRLDDVCHIDGWHDAYRPGPAGGVLCALSLRIGLMGEWITKEDVADNSEIEAVKGGVSDALKRAAVKFGIGRYLYGLDAQWTPFDGYRFTQTPRLPDWALPEALRGQQPNTPPSAQTRQQQPPSAPQGLAAEVSRLLKEELAMTDVAEKATMIGWVCDVNPVELGTQMAVNNAVMSWAARVGIREDIPLAFIARAKARPR